MFVPAEVISVAERIERLPPSDVPWPVNVSTATVTFVSADMLSCLTVPYVNARFSAIRAVSFVDGVLSLNETTSVPDSTLVAANKQNSLVRLVFIEAPYA